MKLSAGLSLQASVFKAGKPQITYLSIAVVARRTETMGSGVRDLHKPFLSPVCGQSGLCVDLQHNRVPCQKCAAYLSTL